MKKIITIFGSSKPMNNEDQYYTAYNLGKMLAKNGFDICTGGFNGIMEAASRGAVESAAEKQVVLLLICGEDILTNTSQKKLNALHSFKELRN